MAQAAHAKPVLTADRRPISCARDALPFFRGMSFKFVVPYLTVAVIAVARSVMESFLLS
jgi:hypothetical protein